MTSSRDLPSAYDQRRDPRKEPYPYYPYVNIDPDGDIELVGFVRNISQGGFSAEFEEGFPFSEGDVLDVRVGYQRAWARVVWIEKVVDSIEVVGFELHPDEFLDSVLQEQASESALE